MGFISMTYFDESGFNKGHDLVDKRLLQTSCQAIESILSWWWPAQTLGVFVSRECETCSLIHIAIRNVKLQLVEIAYSYGGKILHAKVGLTTRSQKASPVLKLK